MTSYLLERAYVGGRVVDGVAAELAGHDPARVVQRRDEALLQLLRIKAAQDLP